MECLATHNISKSGHPAHLRAALRRDQAAQHVEAVAVRMDRLRLRAAGQLDQQETVLVDADDLARLARARRVGDANLGVAAATKQDEQVE